MTPTETQEIVTRALADLMNAVGEKQSGAQPKGGLEALSLMEQHAFDAAVSAIITFTMLRMGRLLMKETT